MFRPLFITLLCVLPVMLYAQKTPTNTTHEVTASDETVFDGYEYVDSITLLIPASQTTTTTGIADYINAHFTTERDKIRAIFIWTADNISYDVPAMYNKNRDESDTGRVNKTLRKRKGVCENYAAVFNEIAEKCKIKCYVVTGYTRIYGVISTQGHAWCAALIDGNWYIIDPTWGSGYVNDDKYTRKIDNSWFLLQPQEAIQSHMPADPLWEFLHYPINNQQFYDNKTEPDGDKTYVSYTDSIAAYDRQNKVERAAGAVYRIAHNGPMNDKTNEELAYQMSIVAGGQFAKANEMYANARPLTELFYNYYNDYSQRRPDAVMQGLADSIDFYQAQSTQMLQAIPYVSEDFSNAVRIGLDHINEVKNGMTKMRSMLDEYIKREPHVTTGH